MGAAMNLSPRFPNERVVIASPKELAEVVQTVSRLVVEGVLVQRKVAGAVFEAPDIADIPVDGPWPDYIDLLFEGPGGKRYRLLAETYHGTGGSWSPEP